MKNKEQELKEFIENDFDFIKGDSPTHDNNTEIQSKSTNSKVGNALRADRSLSNPLSYIGMGYMFEGDGKEDIKTYSPKNMEKLHHGDTNITDEDKTNKIVKFETIHEQDIFNKSKLYDNELQKDIDLPSLYDIKNKRLVSNFYSIIKILNNESTANEDKVGIFSELIGNVDFSEISIEHKKTLVKKLKENL